VFISSVVGLLCRYHSQLGYGTDKASNWLERLVPEMTCYVSILTLNYSLTDSSESTCMVWLLYKDGIIVKTCVSTPSQSGSV